MAKWAKGESGNPGGRPKEVGELRELAREHTQDALKTLLAIIRDKKSPAAAKVSAACAILDRGYGKPSQQLEHTGVEPPDDKPMTLFEAARTFAFVLNQASLKK